MLQCKKYTNGLCISNGGINMKPYEKPTTIQKPELPKPCVRVIKPTRPNKDMNKLNQSKH